MVIRIVQSKQNPRVKELRAALRHPARPKADTIADGAIALEGIHLLAEALRSHLTLETVFIAQRREDLLSELEIPSSVEVLALPAGVLSSSVTTESPQPIAALARPIDWIWRDAFEYNPFSDNRISSPLLVALAGIQDPGNLGTILRSAEAFGATGAILLSGTVSPWNPKAMRASAGSVFRLPILTASASQCFDYLRAAGIPVYAAMAHDAQPVSRIDLSGPVALVVGAEGPGLAPEIAAKCDARILIPTPGPVESLNAAVAASILLYEASRQRSLPQPRSRS